MSERLLETRQLTLRFGGVTAVNQVDLAVDEGQIFSVIGPNGAGKTSLFNAIAGVADPSEGEIRLAGELLEERPGRRAVVRWTLVALGCGVLSLLLSANPDRLWAASIRGNYVDRKTGFSLSEALRDARDHLAGAPAIERRAGRYYVTTEDGQLPFGSSATKAEARRRRDDLLELGARAGADPIVERAGQFVVTSADGARVLDEAPTRAELAHRLRAAETLVGARTRARTLHVVAFIAGVLIGWVAAWAIARQMRRTPSFIAAKGIARTFQNIRLFRDMSVSENLLAVMHAGGRPSLGAHLPAIGAAGLLLAAGIAVRAGLGTILPLACVLAAFGLLGWYAVGAARRGSFSRLGLAREAERRREARELLGFVGLEKRADELAKNLAYGEQRRLEIARALATQPRLLLLDEPAAGMNPAESLSLMETIKRIRERGVTVLLIEHHMRLVMAISDRIAVLHHGSKIAEGTPEEVRRDPAVVEAYLGKEEHAA